MFGRQRSIAKRAPKDIEADKREVQLEIRKMLPTGAKLVRYAEAHSVPRNCHGLASTLKTSESTLKSVINDIRSGAIPDIEKVQGPSTTWLKVWCRTRTR